MMFEAQTEWIAPDNFPDLSGYKFISIDLETRDPDLKSLCDCASKPEREEIDQDRRHIIRNEHQCQRDFLFGLLDVRIFEDSVENGGRHQTPQISRHEDHPQEDPHVEIVGFYKKHKSIWDISSHRWKQT